MYWIEIAKTLFVMIEQLRCHQGPSGLQHLCAPAHLCARDSPCIAVIVFNVLLMQKKALDL